MSLPELEAARVKRIMEKFAGRVPPHVCKELWYSFSTRGNTVSLNENRPHFRDPTKTIQHPIARFKYDPATGKWELWSCDRNGRGHRYPGFAAVPLEAAVAEVERDPTGIFLG